MSTVAVALFLTALVGMLIKTRLVGIGSALVCVVLGLVLGGTPAPGELYGRYQGEGGAALKIETGKGIEDLRIVVEPVW